MRNTSSSFQPTPRPNDSRWALPDFNLWLLLTMVLSICLTVVLVVLISVEFSNIQKIASSGSSPINITALSYGENSSQLGPTTTWSESAACHDGNDCTLDLVTAFGNYRACSHYAIPNNITCTNDCLVVGTGTCQSGECAGLCKGYCSYYINYEESVCPALPFSAEIQTVIEGFQLFYGSLCFYGRCLHFLNWPIVNDWQCNSGSAETPFMQQDHDGDCLSFLDHSSISPECLDASIMCMANGAQMCVYRYGCSGLNIFNQFEVLPSPDPDAGFITPEVEIPGPEMEPSSFAPSNVPVVSVSELGLEGNTGKKIKDKTTLTNPTFSRDKTKSLEVQSPAPKIKDKSAPLPPGTRKISTHNAFLLKHGKRSEVPQESKKEVEGTATPKTNSEVFIILADEYKRKEIADDGFSYDFYDELALSGLYPIKRQSISIDSMSSLDQANEEVVAALGTTNLKLFVQQALNQFIANLNSTGK